MDMIPQTAPDMPRALNLASSPVHKTLKDILRPDARGGQEDPAGKMHARLLDNYCRIHHTKTPRTDSEADRRLYARFAESAALFLGRLDLSGVDDPAEQIPGLFIRFLEERKMTQFHSIQRERDEENEFREKVSGAQSVYESLRIFLEKVDGHDHFAERLHAGLSDVYAGISLDDVAVGRWHRGKPVFENSRACARFTRSVAEFLLGLDRRGLRPAEQLPALYEKFLDGGKNIPSGARRQLLLKYRLLEKNAGSDDERGLYTRAAALIQNREVKIGESGMKALWNIADAISDVSAGYPSRAAAFSVLDWALGLPGSQAFRRHISDLFLLEGAKSPPSDNTSSIARDAFVRLAIAALDPEDADALSAVEFLCNGVSGRRSSFAPNLQMVMEDLNYLRHIAAAEDGLDMGSRALQYYKWKLRQILRPERRQAISDEIGKFYFGPVLAIINLVRNRRLGGGDGRRSVADRFMWGMGQVIGEMAARNEFNKDILKELLSTDPDSLDLRTQVAMAVLPYLPQAIRRGIAVHNQAPADVLDEIGAFNIAAQLEEVIHDIMAETAKSGATGDKGREIRILPAHQDTERNELLMVVTQGQYSEALEERNRFHIPLLSERIDERMSAGAAYTVVYLEIPNASLASLAVPPSAMGATMMTGVRPIG